MSFTVTCPHCSSPLRVRDEHAGRAMKCPTCQETIPAETVRPPADAPPSKSAVRPTPADDEERPRTKRRIAEEDADDRPRGQQRRRDEGDADDRPRSRRRVRDDEDDDDDRPRSRRRARDEDDDEADRTRSRRRSDDRPKKKGGLGLILGILGGVLVLCGGGCAGVYFLGIKPAADRVRAAANQARARNDQLQQEINDALKKEEEARKRPPEVVKRPAEQPPAATVSAADAYRDRKSYTGKWVAVIGRVDAVNKFTEQYSAGLKDDTGAVHIVLQFDPSDHPGGPKFEKNVRYKILGLFSEPIGLSPKMEWCRVVRKAEGGGTPDAPKSDPAKPDAGKPPADDQAIEVTAGDLLAEYARDEKVAAEKYRNKSVRVTGEVKQTTALRVLLAGKPEGGYTYAVSVTLPPDRRAGLSDLKPGDQATATGKVGAFVIQGTTKAKFLTLTDGRLMK